MRTLANVLLAAIILAFLIWPHLAIELFHLLGLAQGR